MSMSWTYPVACPPVLEMLDISLDFQEACSMNSAPHPPLDAVRARIAAAAREVGRDPTP